MLGYAQKAGISALYDAKLAFFLGADECDFTRFTGFKVYVGHHGDKGAAAADVVLPGASYAEKSGTYVNLEGRVQRGNRAVFAPGDSPEEWTILRALSEKLGAVLPFDDNQGWDRWQAAREDTAALRRATALTRRWASLRDAMMRDLAQRI
jgi:NADH-quinone oxidoreductase subunit G